MNSIKATLSFTFFLLVASLAQFGTAQDYYPMDSTLSGHWQGSWQSCNTGHRGKLNANFCRIDAKHVQADFRGNFAKIIPFRYRPVLNIVHEEPGLMVLQGSKRLPLMGNFEYQATVTGNSFQATYRSRRDHGIWQMQR